jgi:hypothetical protein
LTNNILISGRVGAPEEIGVREAENSWAVEILKGAHDMKSIQAKGRRELLFCF